MRPPDVVTLAVTRVDGGVTVVRVVTVEYFPDGTPRWTIDPTPDYLARIVAKHDWRGPHTPVSWRLVPNDYVDEATDHTFREAWEDVPGRGKPTVQMERAKGVWRDRLRALRAPMLDALDRDYLRADEDNDPAAKARIVAEKRRLRDLPADPRIDAAQTPDDLLRVVP